MWNPSTKINGVCDTEHVPDICKVPSLITAYRLKLEETPLSAGSRKPGMGKSTAPLQKYMAIYELERGDFPRSDA